MGGEGAISGLHHVLADVIFEDFGHEAVDAAAHVGEEHEDVGAVGVAGERALDGVDLAANAFNASEKFFIQMVCHRLAYTLGGYDITPLTSPKRRRNLQDL